MAQQLYFSRDTRMFIQFRNPADNTETAAKLGAGAIWEVPVLDGYSFSQTTNRATAAFLTIGDSSLPFMVIIFRAFPPDLFISTRGKVFWFKVTVFSRMPLSSEIRVYREKIIGLAWLFPSPGVDLRSG